MHRSLVVVFGCSFLWGCATSEQQRVNGRAPDATQLVKGCAVLMADPKYPEAARLRRITGLGYFDVHVRRSTGRVTQIIMVRSTGNRLLDAAAVDGLRQWQFKPGCLPSPKGNDAIDRAAAAAGECVIGQPVHFVL
jgi:TonB family protein